MGLSLSLYIYIYIYTYIFVCVCVCVWACVCVCINRPQYDYVSNNDKISLMYHILILNHVLIDEFIVGSVY